MVKFEPKLKVTNGRVMAEGPFDPNTETIVELCAWVYQRDGNKDAAVTEMTHQDVHGNHVAAKNKGHGELKTVGEKWQMELAKVGEKPMKAGEAFAVAVAMVKYTSGDLKGDQQVIWWGHPVELVE